MIIGWRKNPTDVHGKPDFVFDKKKLVVFVDGCFWHGCPTCRNIPATNTEFWQRKIQRTKERDEQVTKTLTKDGWQVLRMWEHDLRKQPTESLNRILLSLRSKKRKIKHSH
jgi:DNA mismatch endonuclease, patch repair protein